MNGILLRCRMCLVEVDGVRGFPPACTMPVTDGMVVPHPDRRGEEGPGRRARVPAREPPARLPGVRPRWRVPVAGPHARVRSGRDPLHRGEAPLREADPDQRRRAARPRALHPVRARCTRFADEIAGDPLISFVDRGDRTEVLNFPDHPFASYFSGNVVQICPVGALTAKPYRFRARPWDLDDRRDEVHQCAVQCRGALQSTTQPARALLGVDSEPVNHGWLCDKGRFGFEYVHNERACRRAARARATATVASVARGARRRGRRPARARELHGAGAIAVLGGARGTNEDAYAWARLAKGVLGTDNVDAQLGDGLPAEVVLGLPRADDRRLRPRRRDRAARSRPQGRAAGAAPARAPRRRRARRAGRRLPRVRARAHERARSRSRPGPGEAGAVAERSCSAAPRGAAATTR